MQACKYYCKLWQAYKDSSNVISYLATQNDGYYWKNIYRSNPNRTKVSWGKNYKR